MALGNEPTPAAGERVAVALAGAEEQLERLGRELAEIEMLEQQARGEAARHEQRLAQAADRLAAAQSRPDADSNELQESVAQVVTLTRRSAMMESQVDVLAGKRTALTRYRDHLAILIEALHAAPQQAAAAGSPEAPDDASMPATVSRAILSAQEDMRRDIARAMHDGPAQSLANIVLQAQIVERLVAREPEAALLEAGRLIEVVQHALDTTKAFIFSVRPMVLDDLGLVPTLRRLARDRGRASKVPVEFDSLGPDRRLDIELETGLFRIFDETTVAYLETAPARVSLSLTWEPSSLAARVQAVHTAETVLALPSGSEPPAEPPASERGTREQGDDLPPALAAMIREQREDEAALAPRAEPPRPQGLPAATWRAIDQRARSLGIEVRLSDEGRCLDLSASLPA
jgi:two-component system sensor histidine kinase DegS